MKPVVLAFAVTSVLAACASQKEATPAKPAQPAQEAPKQAAPAKPKPVSQEAAPHATQVAEPATKPAETTAPASVVAIAGMPAGHPADDAKPVAIYDENANAAAQIDAAVARAKKDNRRVLIQWGANWCGWCVKLHSLYKSDKAIAHELLYEYDLVMVDIGEKGDERFHKNVDLATKYAADFQSAGVPYLTVLDGDGKVLANQDTGALENGDSHDPKKVLDFMTAHQAAPLAAADVRSAALVRAKHENKRVFEHFGAPWCPWCHKLEDWMAQPEVAALLAKDFVDLKIDVDRMTGGADVLKSARGPDGEGGIPWFVFLDADGQALINSDSPKGNVGFPSQDFEIAHVVSMLEKVRVNLKPADVDALQRSLVAEHDKFEAARSKAKAASASGTK